MDKKEIQEQRMKSYFIEAAKKMLRGEGFRSISVRNIADQAGYSYATLYNYFKDLREVLFYCLMDFMKECREFTLAANKPKQPANERLLAMTKAYCNYFVQYPSTFELIFTERISEIYSQEKLSVEIDNFFDSIFSEIWIDFNNESSLDEGQILKIKIMHKHYVHSMLMFYLLRRTPKTYKEFMTEIEKVNDLCKM